MTLIYELSGIKKKTYTSYFETKLINYVIFRFIK